MITDTFRGLRADELARIISFATSHGALVIMKQANVPDNLGKSPELVLAEHLILSIHRLSGEPVDD